MDILAIAALEAFDGAPQQEDEKPALAAAVAGVKRKAEGGPAEVSADDIDPALSLEEPSPSAASGPPPPPPPLPRLSASLANILSSASASASAAPSANATASTSTEQASPQAAGAAAATTTMSSPYRTSMPLQGAPPTSSPGGASTSSDVTMVYYGPPERLSEDSGLIRCICPYDDDDGFTIQCERCFAWLHGLCVDISPETVPDIYTCPLCVSGGRIARHIEARAARLQQLRKEAEEGLRRQRIKSNASYASTSNNLSPSSDPAVPTSELDEEYELLAKARGLAYQQSFDNNYTPSQVYTQLPPQPPPHQQQRTSRPTQSPYYQREQLPVQQHTLGPSPFLHPPPQASLPSSSSSQTLQPGSASHPQQGRRAGSVASNASNQSGSAANAKRTKSSSPGGTNLNVSGSANTANVLNAPQTNQGAKAPKKRSSHASQPSLPSIPQNSVLASPGMAGASKDGTNAQGGQGDAGMIAPPPPKKRRSASAKEKEKEKDTNEVPPSVLAPTSGSIATNTALSSQQQLSSSTTVKETAAQLPGQSARKTRLSASSVIASSVDANGSISGQNANSKGPGAIPNFPPQASTSNAGPPSGSKDAFLSDDDEMGMEDRIEPWQFEYTPINYLRYADRSVEQAVNEMVEQYVDEERENLNGNTGDNDDRTGTAGSSRRDSPFGQHSRNSSARPSLLGTSSLLSGIAHASRMASPVPSSGSSTPAYSSSGVASALAPPCLPLILPEPPISPSEFSSKLSVKPLATSSMSLAPPACTPFSGPTCVPSLMNPYPRPTIHGVFTSTAFTAGTLITFMNGEVISGEEYRDDPINQWHDLGVLKCHTRGIAQPWDLVLDQRRFADESRFIRNGCHPNVFTKPVIIRKSRNGNETGTGKKGGRSAAKRKADQQKAVQEGGDFELVFGLYALQDIAKREELVLPFDWADDHVVHSLHTLLFSPSLVFPTIPSNVESETEDDGIPSTSSFTHLTASQKGQIAQCTKHLYRLSRLASQTCLTLLGTSICACEKRRDCSIAWLWKLACFSESSSARSRGTIQLQDFDLNGLRAACASALATDDKDWVATPGANGRMSNKKSSRKRRADLGALVGLARGWERPRPEAISAIPPRLTSEEEEEQIIEEQNGDDKMEIDATEQAEATHTPTVEHAKMDFDTIHEEDVVLNSMPTSAELEKADSPFQFVAPPEPAEQGKLQSSAPISHDEGSKFQSTSLLPPSKDEADVSPLNTRPNTSQSVTSDAKETVSKPSQPVQDDDSDSDITEPLPSDHSDNEEQVNKPARKSPVKEMAKRVTSDKRKTTAEPNIRASRKSPAKDDDMQVDEEEVVRPPKKKKLLRKLEVDKTSNKIKPAQKIKKQEAEEEEKTQASAKKALKSKLKAAKSGDDGSPKQRPSFGGLPSFRTKKQVDQAKEAAAQKAQEEAAKPVEAPPAPAVPLPAQTPAASETPAPISQASALDSLFDLPAPPKPIAQKETPKSNVVGPSEEVMMEVEQPTAPQVQHRAAADVAVAGNHDTMQVDKQSEQSEKPATAPAENAAQVAPSPGTLEEPVIAPAPAAPAVRRVSFQAYKKRVSTAPAASTVAEPIAEEAATTTSPTVQTHSDTTKKSSILSVNSEMASEPVLGGDIVQTPIIEKSNADAEQIVSKPDAESINTAAPVSPVIAQASPAPTQASLPGAIAAPAPKARLSFAAYRQRATTAPKPLPVASSPAVPATKPLVGTTPPAPASAALQLTKTLQAEEPVKELAQGSAIKPAIAPVEEPAQLPSVAQEAGTQSKPEPPAGVKEIEMKKDEDEQEEGELFVDPNLEPGEVETESALPANASSTALGMRMGELQQPEASSSRTQPIKQSYTPPSRHRSLTPPRPALTRQTEDKHNADGHSNQSTTSRSANPDKDQSAPSSNANWAPLGRDRPVSPVASTDKSLPESSRYSASGASPPTHPRGFSKVSPRNTFNAPLPASKPPTGPRNPTAPWPARGRANSAAGSIPGGRGAASGDPIYGGGFGTAGSGGSSYRPASGGRSDGPPPPPPRSSQPPSGPRALQSSNSYLAPRGRGRHEGGPPGASRDRGWGSRGRGRGGRDYDRGGYRGGYH